MTSDAHETETDRLGSNGTKEHLNAQPATFTTSHHAASPSLGSLATTTSTVSHSNSVSVSGSASDLDAPQTPSDVDGGSASLHGGHSELAIVGGTDTDVQQRPGYTSVTMGQGSDMAAAAAATQKRMSSAAAFEAALGGQRTSSAKDAEIKRLSSISNATAIAVASSPSAVTDSSPSLEHSRIATPLPPPPPGPKPHRLSSASLGSCDSSSRKSFMALPVVAKHNATSSIETTKRASLPISAIASPTTPTLTASNQAIRLPSEEQRRNRVSSTASSSSSSRSVGKRPPTPPAKPANLVVAVNQAMSRQQDNDESANGNGSRSSAPSSASNAESWLLVSTPAEAAGKMIGGSPLEEQETTPAVDVTDMEMLSEGPTAGQVPSAMARQASSGSERGGALGIGRPSSIASSLGAASTSSGEPVRLPVAFSAEAQSAPASFADRPTHIRKSSFSRVLDSFAVGSALRSGNSTPGVTTKSSVQPPSVAAKPSWLKRTASSSKNLATKSLGFATKERSPSMRTVELQADQPGPPSLPPRQTRPGGSGQAGATAPTISLDAQDDLPLSRSRSKSPAPAVESDSLLPLPPPPRREFGSRGRSMEVPRSASSSLGPSDSGNRLRTGLNVVNKRLGSWANDNQAVRQNLGQAPSMIGSAMSSGWSALRASRSSTSPSIAAGITGDTISPGFADGSQIPPGIIKRPRLPGSSSAVFGQDPTQAALLWPVVDAESVSSFDNNSRRSKRRKCLPAVATRCVDFLLVCAPKEEGIFRVSGRSSQVTAFKKLFDSGADLDFSADMLDPHDVASLYKAYLRELPVSILTIDTSPVFDQIMQRKLGVKALDADFGAGRLPGTEAKTTTGAVSSAATSDVDNGDLVTQLRSALDKLPDANWWLLADLSRLLHGIDAGKADNKMSLQNLLLVFCPTVNLSPGFLKLIVERHTELFGATVEAPSQTVTQTVTVTEPNSRFGTPIADKFARSQPIELSLRDDTATKE